MPSIVAERVREADEDFAVQNMKPAMALLDDDHSHLQQLFRTSASYHDGPASQTAKGRPIIGS